MDAVHLHLALNHVPIVGVALATLLLAWGLLRRDGGIIRLAFGGIALMAFTTVAVYFTGEPAEELVEGMAGVHEPSLERHEEAALLATVLAGALGVAALAGFLFTRGRSPVRYGLLLLALSVIPIAALARTANLGGQIRHPEIRAEAWPTPEPPTAVEWEGPDDGD